MQTLQLNLTSAELEHVRDLFSVKLPLDMRVTVSQSLAAATGHEMFEAVLWNKVSQLCTLARLPLNDSAPDFVVAALSAPPMGVFEMKTDNERPDDGSHGHPSVFPDKDDK